MLSIGKKTWYMRYLMIPSYKLILHYNIENVILFLLKRFFLERDNIFARKGIIYIRLLFLQIIFLTHYIFYWRDLLFISIFMYCFWDFLGCFQITLIFFICHQTCVLDTNISLLNSYNIVFVTVSPIKNMICYGKILISYNIITKVKHGL